MSIKNKKKQLDNFFAGVMDLPNEAHDLVMEIDEDGDLTLESNFIDGDSGHIVLYGDDRESVMMSIIGLQTMIKILEDIKFDKLIPPDKSEIKIYIEEFIGYDIFMTFLPYAFVRLESINRYDSQETLINWVDIIDLMKICKNYKNIDFSPLWEDIISDI